MQLKGCECISDAVSAEYRGVYSISTAASKVGSTVQTLRLYETRHLIEPDRTAGGTRRYSDYDIDRLERIVALVDDGINLAGVGVILNLQDENARLRAQHSTGADMTDKYGNRIEVSETDLADQHTPIDHTLEGDREDAFEPLATRAITISEADWVDSQIEVSVDEDQGSTIDQSLPDHYTGHEDLTS